MHVPVGGGCMCEDCGGVWRECQGALCVHVRDRSRPYIWPPMALYRWHTSVSKGGFVGVGTVRLTVWRRCERACLWQV